MKYFSTNNPGIVASTKDAVFNGLAPDGGLYMPEQIPALKAGMLRHLESCTFQYIAFEIAAAYFGTDVSANKLRDIVDSAFDFPVPIRKLDENISCLELFHGPSLAFKDFGARFMARLMNEFLETENREAVVLVATSGDTGGAAAAAFSGLARIRLIILYPAAMVSELQERQLTTWGDNVLALRVDGTFDDCQRLAKSAFLDADLRKQFLLASANSINIARLIPQMLYYAEAYKSLLSNTRPLVISVPSGNLGNLTAGLMLKHVGADIDLFLSATNANHAFSDYLESGKLSPHRAIRTLSNAMDVGNPSNLSRIQSLYRGDLRAMREDIQSLSLNDDQTLQSMRDCYERYNYVIDPHTAVAYGALKKQLEKSSRGSGLSAGIFLGTAHPAKFPETVKRAIGRDIDLPPVLAALQTKEKNYRVLSKSFDDFRALMIAL